MKKVTGASYTKRRFIATGVTEALTRAITSLDALETMGRDYVLDRLLDCERRAAAASASLRPSEESIAFTMQFVDALRAVYSAVERQDAEALKAATCEVRRLIDDLAKWSARSARKSATVEEIEEIEMAA